MERSHLYLPITDPVGDLFTFVDVSLLDPNTRAQVTTVQAWDGPGDTAQPLSWPATFSPGIIDLWLDGVGRYDLNIVGPDNYSGVIPGVDFGPSANNQGRGTLSPIAGLPSLGNWLDATTLRFVAPGLASPHDHDGTQGGSTVLNLSTDVDVVADDTWVGYQAGDAADGGTTTALGANANPAAANADVLGSTTTVGANYSLVVGSGSSSAGTETVVLGDTNPQTADDGVYLPLDSSGAETTYVENGPKVHLRSVFLDSAADQIGDAIPVPGSVPAGVTRPVWLGGDARFGGADLRGNVRLASATGKVSLFDGVGAVRLARPAGGAGALTSLLDALVAYGLLSP